MQHTHLRLTTRRRYPWELSDETRRVGKEGLARVRAILDAKAQGPDQQVLKLDFSSPSERVAPTDPPLRRPLAA
ncbi:MAG: hypothetical protein HKN24_00670 [Acidimicrobiales bacterium]|nr:hypothetical protein [Acidimicrobiales bacterium]